MLLRRVHAWGMWPWRLLWEALVGGELRRAARRWSVLGHSTRTIGLNRLRLVLWRWWPWRRRLRVGASVRLLWTGLERCLSRRVGREVWIRRAIVSCIGRGRLLEGWGLRLGWMWTWRSSKRL